MSTRFAAGHTQQQVAAVQRIKAAFSEIAKGNGLSGLSLDAKAALQGSLKSAAVKLEKTLAAGGEPKTDFPLAHTLARQFAEDPDGFAGINIYELSPEFSQATFKLLESWHELARKGSDEADERAAEIAALFEQGTRHVIDAGLDPDSRDEDIQPKISRFLFRFVAEASDFQTVNGTLPGDEDLAEIARQLRPLLPEAPEPPEPPIPVPADNPSRPDFRHWMPWKLRYEQYFGQDGGNHADAVIQADRDVEEAIAFNKKHAGIPLGKLSPVRRAFYDQVRFQMFSGPEGIPGSFGRFMEQVAFFLLDFVPIIGDVKAFYEAEDLVDTSLAVAGLLPYLGDIGAKVLKRVIKASKRDLEPPPDENPLDDNLNGGDPYNNETKFDEHNTREPDPNSRIKDGDDSNQADGLDIDAIDFEQLATSGRNLDPADKQGKLTYAGRALDKHGSKQGKRADSDAFPKPSGNQERTGAKGTGRYFGLAR